MQVYYGMNFWGSAKAAQEPKKITRKVTEPLQKITLNQEFLWNDISGFIPAVYTGNEGIVVDFCIRVSNEAFQAFCDKWRAAFENGLKEEEQEQMAEENPLHIDFRLELCVNGQTLEADCSCGTCYSKITAEEYRRGGIEEQLMQAYNCDDAVSWCFKRYMFRWEQQPEKLQKLDLHFMAGQKAYAGAQIEIDLECKGKQYEIVHPISGDKYELRINDIVQKEMDREILQGRRARQHNWEYPTNYIMVSYRMEPELAREKFRLHDITGGDRPRNMSTHESGNVSILIGGDGPTSIFIAGKMKEKQDMIAASALYFEPVTNISWKPVFMEKEREDMQLHIDLSGKED